MINLWFKFSMDTPLYGSLFVCTSMLVSVVGLLIVRRFVNIAWLKEHHEVASYFFLMIGATGAANTQWATVLLGCSWLAFSTYLAVRGLKWSSRTQIILLAIGLAVLFLFAAVAVIKLIAATAGHQAISF